MSKIKLTKSEMKKQRDSLKQFKRYLPTLQLKKQQLQSKILEVRKILEDLLSAYYGLDNKVKQWRGLLADPFIVLKGDDKVPNDNPVQWNERSPEIDLKIFLTPKEIVTDTVNITGANVPVFKDVIFHQGEYDLYNAPFWLDRGIEEFRKLVKAMAEVDTVKKQIRILEHELRVTTQRVNLFEKIKIPEAQENIRKISIYLGDQQANAVGISKVAKKKVEQRNLEAVAA